MRKKEEFTEKWRAPLVLSFIVLLICFGIVQYHFLKLNDMELCASGESTDQDVTVEMDINMGKSERWSSNIMIGTSPASVKTFVGETINGTITNQNSYDIKNWFLKISPKNDCYLNGFWGGSVEVHQFRGGEEIVETIASIVSNDQIEKLDVNSYVDFMMVHFCPGDYFIFYPMRESGADKITAGNYASVVFNFYYRDPLDFSNYELYYKNDIRIKETWVYPVMIVVGIIWLCAFFPLYP